MNMNSFILFILLFVNIILCGVGDTIYTATLSPNQVVGSYVSAGNERSVGTCYCNIKRYLLPPQIFCSIQHNLDELTSGSIKSGARGTNGDEISSINILTGTHLSISLNISSNDVLESILDGLWYIELYTIDYPNGELRGQIEHQDRFYSVLNTQNTIPRASGSDGTGISVGTYSPQDRILDFNLIHDVTLPLGTDLLSGLPGVIGEYKATFPGESPLFQVVSLTRSEDEDLLFDRLYLNIRSNTNPQGDIRGQFISIDYIPEGAFTSVLSGTESGNNSPSTGIAIFSFNCDTDILDYVVMHNVQTPLSSVVLNSAGVIFSLPSGTSPIFGKIQLSQAEAGLLYNEELIISIQSTLADGPNGEISGIIGSDYNMFSYLSGTNVIPPVTTHYVGTMVLRFIEENVLEYELIHNVDDAVDIAIMLGIDGENSNVELLSIPVTESPSSGNLIIDDDIIDAFLFDSTYIEIRTRSKPFGVIRGSIRNLNPCTLVYDYDISLPEDSDGTLQSSDTSVLSYLSYIDKDDDEFDVYVEVINTSNIISTNLLHIITSCLIIWLFIIIL